eukprot:5335402-Prymnesium_polylepis.1
MIAYWELHPMRRTAAAVIEHLSRHGVGRIIRGGGVSVSGRGGGRGVAGGCRARVAYRSGPIPRGAAFYLYYYFLDFGDA